MHEGGALQMSEHMGQGVGSNGECRASVKCEFIDWGAVCV